MKKYTPLLALLAAIGCQITPDQLDTLTDPIAQTVAELRGTEFTGPVTRRVCSREELVRIASAELDHDLPPELLGHKQAFLRHVGAWPSGQDLRETALSFLKDQAAGLYRRTLVLNPNAAVAEICKPRLEEG